jgi:hypothetical protein
LALVSPNSAYQIAEFVVAPQKPDPSVPYALPEFTRDHRVIALAAATPNPVLSRATVVRAGRQRRPSTVRPVPEVVAPQWFHSFGKVVGADNPVRTP